MRPVGVANKKNFQCPSPFLFSRVQSSNRWSVAAAPLQTSYMALMCMIIIHWMRRCETEAGEGNSYVVVTMCQDECGAVMHNQLTGSCN